MVPIPVILATLLLGNLGTLLGPVTSTLNQLPITGTPTGQLGMPPQLGNEVRGASSMFVNISVSAANIGFNTGKSASGGGALTRSGPQFNWNEQYWVNINGPISVSCRFGFSVRYPSDTQNIINTHYTPCIPIPE